MSLPPDRGGGLIDVRPVLFINGFVLLVLAIAMGLPAAVGAMAMDADWPVFLAASGTTAFAGGMLMLGAKPDGRFRLQVRQAFLLTASAWVLASLCAAMPFLFSTLGLSVTDAVFEATSGLTTTGATVIVGLDHAPTGILLWRALLNWLGGLGIIVMAVAVLPMLGIGGMQMFKMETSDKNDKIRARVSKVIAAIALVYVGLTLASAVAFWLAGMGRFDAACHAMAALSTGGFSTSDASLAHWGRAVQWVAVASMVLGGAPLPLLVASGRSGRPALLDDRQFRSYLTLLGGAALVIGIWRWATSDWGLDESLLQSAFSVTSVVTSTGFVATDYGAWGGFAQVAFFALAFAGGCTGSASGAIKIFRWQVLGALAKVHVKRLLHPHGVFVITFNRRKVGDPVIDSVLAFVVLYIATFAIHAMVLTATGLDLVTALTGSAAALGNLGRGLGDVIGPAGNWRALPDAAKWVLSFEMLVGRLELFTVFILFTPSFWRE